MNAGVVFWSLAVVGMCFLLLAIGLLGNLVWVSRDQEEADRRRWEEARSGD